MALDTPPTADGEQLLLADPRFELMPFDTFGEQLTHLPDGATVTVTASPSLGIEPTVEWAERAGEDGYDAVPHLAARYVEDRDELGAYAERMKAVGVTDIFVPGGDREEPKGEFESAHELLVALEELGYSFEEVGITGYPEGHHFLSDETLAESMARKAPRATYITSQICYHPDRILDWIGRIRDRGVALPVEIGVPGVMNYRRLLRISRQFGVGDSIQFLEKTSGVLDFLRRLVGSRGTFTPDRIVDGLAPHADDPHYGIRGLNLYTFNEVPDTESWRRDRLHE